MVTNDGFCPHCYGSLNRSSAPTILPPPWFDHHRREVIVDGERRRLRGGAMFRLLVIFWERQERLLSKQTLMDLLYANDLQGEPPYEKIIEVEICLLRKALRGTPYSIINRIRGGYMLTTRPLEAHDSVRNSGPGSWRKR